MNRWQQRHVMASPKQEAPLGRGTGYRLVRGRELEEMQQLARVITSLGDSALDSMSPERQATLASWMDLATSWHEGRPSFIDFFAQPTMSRQFQTEALWLESVVAESYAKVRRRFHETAGVPSRKHNTEAYELAAGDATDDWFVEMQRAFDLEPSYAWSVVFPLSGKRNTKVLDGDADAFRALLGDLYLSQLLLPVVEDDIAVAHMHELDWDEEFEEVRDVILSRLALVAKELGL